MANMVTQESLTLTCKYCRGKHKAVRTQCPAYGKSCHLCGKANHFHTVCFQGKPHTKASRSIAAVPSEPSESDDELYVIEQVGAVNTTAKDSFCTHMFQTWVGDTTIDCQ